MVGRDTPPSVGLCPGAGAQGSRARAAVGGTYSSCFRDKDNGRDGLAQWHDAPSPLGERKIQQVLAGEWGGPHRGARPARREARSASCPGSSAGVCPRALFAMLSRPHVQKGCSRGLESPQGPCWRHLHRVSLPWVTATSLRLLALRQWVKDRRVQGERPGS